MVSARTRVGLRIAFALFLLLLAFYVGRPLYWKLSATIHDIRENRQTVKQGISQFVLHAQRSVGWYHDESDSGVPDDPKAGAARTRRILRFVHQLSSAMIGSSWLVLTPVAPEAPEADS